MRVECEKDPRGSKVFASSDPQAIISACMEEIFDGLKLNVADMVFYAAALELAKCAILGELDEGMMKAYEALIEGTRLVNIKPITGASSEEGYE